MLRYFTSHLDVTLQSTRYVASPERTLYPSDFSIKFRMHSYSTHTHYMALSPLQPSTVHHSKEMVLSTNHEALLFTFSLVQMFSSTPDLTQSLPHMFRSCKDDPIFHLAVHNPPPPPPPNYKCCALTTHHLLIIHLTPEIHLSNT